MSYPERSLHDGQQDVYLKLRVESRSETLLQNSRRPRQAAFRSWAAKGETKMKTKISIIFITLVFGAVAFALGPVIWPPSPDIHPTQAQLPYLILLSVIEALTFGFGVAFVLYGRRLVSGAGRTAGAMYISLSWLLLSWWPHDNMHIHNALDIKGLIVIDYVFHFTVILATLVVAYAFFALFRPEARKVETRAACPADQPDCDLSPARS